MSDEPKRLTKREEKQLAIVYGDSMEEEPKKNYDLCELEEAIIINALEDYMDSKSWITKDDERIIRKIIKKMMC